jgi:hypothetical protein
MARLRNPENRVTAGAQATARTRTDAQAQREYRAGRRAENRSPVLTWTAPRNGYPVRFYVYRGNKPWDGRDVL